MAQRSSLFLHAVAVCIVTASIGTAISVGVANAFWRGHLPWYRFAVGVAIVHLFLSATFTLMGESIIEDAVKAVVVVAIGLMAGKTPGAPFAIISAAIFAVAANAYTKWIGERRRSTSPPMMNPR